MNNYYKKCNLKERLLFAKLIQIRYSKYQIFFDENKAPGIDDLSGVFLRDGASLLVTPIKQLYNLSISSDRFPDAYKIVKLKPLFKRFKNGSQELPSNLPSTTYVKSAGENST